MLCDELKEYTNPTYGSSYYDIDEVNAAIAELKEFAENACIERDDNQTAIDELQAENAELKKKLMPCLNGDCILTCEVVEKYGKENAELKAKLEDVQASHYAEMVDAGMRERKLKRALWLARAERAIAEAEYWYGHTSGMYYIDAKDVPDEEDDPYKRVKDTTIGWYKTWMNVERKCRAKAEEYK